MTVKRRFYLAFPRVLARFKGETTARYQRAAASDHTLRKGRERHG
jgi:hypothetical protein